MPTKYLTEQTIRTLPVPERGQRDFWDTSLPSFGCRVSMGGAKTFVLKQQNRRYTLGRWPIITLKQARDEAKRRIALKYLPQTAFSTQTALQEFLAFKKRHLKPRTFIEINRHLTRFPLPQYLNQISTSQVHKHLDTLHNSQSAQHFYSLKAFLNWCVDRQYLQINPLQAARRQYKTISRDRLLANEEIKLIWKESYNHNSFGQIIRLLLLTGQRLNQITSLQQTWVRRDSLVFPASVMKSNAEHTIPLTPQTAEELQTPLTKLSTAHLTLFLFPGPTADKPFSAHSQAMKKFREALPQIPHFTLHDFRRYFSSTHARIGTAIDITEALLDHRSGSRSQIQRVYDRFDRLEPMRLAMRNYEAYLRSLFNLPTTF